MRNFKAIVHHRDIIKAIRWARGNCPSYYDHQTCCDDAARYDLFFRDESDAVLCRLRWS